MTRPPADFEAAAREHNIDRWPMRNCSFCEYPLAFLFDDDGSVFFDAGCDCVGRYRLEPRAWADVANQYNIQTHDRVIAKYDEFWHFAPAAESA